MPQETLSPTQAITTTPLTPLFGAVVGGVDAKEPLRQQQVKELRQALMTYKVLFLRNQHLGYEQQSRFASYFGELLFEPFVNNIPGYPGLSHVDRTPFFHSDLMQMEDGPKFSMLQMTDVPPAGGDTMFADLVASYEDLSPVLREFLEQRTGLFASRGYDFASGGREYAKQRAAKIGGGDVDAIRETIQPHHHPLVRLIPETGKKNYWICDAFTRSIDGLTEDESKAILDLLFRHQLQPKYVIRWRWEAGDIAFWDHRTTLHSGIADYGPALRHGVRATVGGGRPVAVASN